MTRNEHQTKRTKGKDMRTPALKRTREEAAEMVLYSMVADMRRQGWTLTDEQATSMVDRIKKEIGEVRS